jgi:hypothetical protein
LVFAPPHLELEPAADDLRGIGLGDGAAAGGAVDHLPSRRRLGVDDDLVVDVDKVLTVITAAPRAREPSQVWPSSFVLLETPSKLRNFEPKKMAKVAKPGRVRARDHQSGL